MEAPIGYLLHHRGHTHTVMGLGVLAFALALAYRVAPRTRRPPLSEQFRLWLLIAMALASHLLLDALNNYGVHPFYPFDSTWYFADAGHSSHRCGFLALPPVMPVHDGYAARRSRRWCCPSHGLDGFIPMEGAAPGGRRPGMPGCRRERELDGACDNGCSGGPLTSQMARTAAMTALEPEPHGRPVDDPDAEPVCWVLGVMEWN
jgi:hypothetical protein